MSAPEFGVLPPTKTVVRSWGATADALRARPGEWAKITTRASATSASSFVHQSRNGGRTAFRPVGHWEFAARGCDVWARYIGERASS